MKDKSRITNYNGKYTEYAKQAQLTEGTDGDLCDSGFLPAISCA